MGARKPKGLNRVAKIGYGHLCMREENDEVDQIKSVLFKVEISITHNISSSELLNRIML